MDTELKTKYDALPADVKKAVESSEMPKKIEEIGRKNGLHMDQIGLLEEAVGGVILGVSPIDDFVDTLEDRLKIDTEKAIVIATDVNVDIFQSIRQSMMGGEKEETPRTSVPTPEESIRKDDILAEIENPTPTVHPITVDTGGPAMAREVITQQDKKVANEFIGGKLTETVNIPAQTVLTKKEPTLQHPDPNEPAPKKYAVDPYREPLI